MNDSKALAILFIVQLASYRSVVSLAFGADFLWSDLCYVDELQILQRFFNEKAISSAIQAISANFLLINSLSHPFCRGQKTILAI
jgi:hypothetical protein